jgi:hypothetical protein
MSSLAPDFPFNELPGNTIVPDPEEKEIFIPYLNRLYEDVAFAVNNKDNIYFTAPITDTATNIPNMPNLGAYVICISGVDTGMPAYVFALAKNNANLAGAISAALISQVGTIAPWVGATLTITSTTTNFQINHSVTNVIGNFNFRFIGTQ